MAITLTTYMNSDLYQAGYKAFFAGIKSSGYTTPEWAAIWNEGWECAKCEAEELANSECGSIW